jgi:predicted CXXCH cytochrome family protein
VKSKSIAALFLCGGAAMAAALLLNSCGTVTSDAFTPPAVPGAHYVGNQACVDCHADLVRKFPASPHARIHFQSAALSGQSGCESCHGPGSKHVEAGGGRGKFIVNPGKDPAVCFQCHLEIQAEFSLPQHHPVLEGRMNCVQCHDPHGEDIFKPSSGLAMAQRNENCAQCHREQTQPFIFEHEALREGCTICHSPHGSINRKMLVDSDPNLCLRCHAQVQSGNQVFIGKVPHAALLQQGTCWASGCHTAVHGSNVQPQMLF